MPRAGRHKRATDPRQRTGGPHGTGGFRLASAALEPGPPSHHHAYVDQITRDGSRAPISLRGKAFLLLTPHLPAVQEIAGAGDFEADPGFGIGLSRRAAVRVSVFSDPTRVIVDLAR